MKATITLTADDRRALGNLGTHDAAGTHFYRSHHHDWLLRMEDAGLISISRPTHNTTGISMSEEHHEVSVAKIVCEFFDSMGDLIDGDEDLSIDLDEIDLYEEAWK